LRSDFALQQFYFCDDHTTLAGHLVEQIVPIIFRKYLLAAQLIGVLVGDAPHGWF